MKSGHKLLVIALLFAGLVLVNYLASQLPVRGDATADNIYTLSPGTRSLLGKIEEPMTLDFYFSKDAAGLPVSYKNFAARVQEMARQYARASGGKLTLNVVNPQPDTPEEERAAAAGIDPQVIPNTGERIFFGLVATQADQQKALTALSPQRESFLEYDLSQLIYSVQQLDRKKLGLITALPLKAPPFNMMMRQRPQPDQLVIGEWARTFEIIPIEPGADKLPDGLDALAVIHPTNLPPKLQFAIDQFILGGKPAFIAVDPASQFFKQQGGQMGMMGGSPNLGSNLATLLPAYGITYSPDNAVGDPVNATRLQTGAGLVTSVPTWITFAAGSLNAKAAPTAQLNSVLFVEAGSFTVKNDAGLTVTPLVESSPKAGDLPTFTLQFTQPEELSRQLLSTGKKTLAAVIQGKFKTAFPDGAPKDEPKPADPANPTATTPPAPSPQPSTLNPQLRESATTSTILLFADTDWLFDDYSVRRYNFLGSEGAEPLNDNLAFASNALEFLAGSQDLISIRGKGSALREFTVVRDMRVEAQKKYQEQLTVLEARLTEVQGKLTELQGKRTDGARLVATPEMQAAIEDFQKQQIAIRRQLRETRRALREDVDALGNRLLAFNLLATPLLVGAFGLWFYRARRR